MSIHRIDRQRFVRILYCKVCVFFRICLQLYMQYEYNVAFELVIPHPFMCVYTQCHETFLHPNAITLVFKKQELSKNETAKSFKIPIRNISHVIFARM